MSVLGSKQTLAISTFNVGCGPELDFAKSASFPILQFLKGADREAFVASAAAV